MSPSHTEIPVNVYGETYTVDQSCDISTLYHAKRKFFTRFGINQKYMLYRGCIITRYSWKMPNGHYRRVTVPYLFAKSSTGEWANFCLTKGREIHTPRDAKDIIDRVLTTGDLHA